MINPVSSGPVASIPNVPAVKPQTAPASNSPSGSSAVQDTVELSSHAKGASSSTGPATHSGGSSYAPPSTVAAHSSRGGAAS